ncbi:MAG: NUDIX domain-containing protein [Promethearchaeota archaeon]|jgi:8-oxo-dGTP pyrophosphatase MutT (NUDIX family)
MSYDKNKSHYVTVTGIIVNKDGKYLIAKRAEWEKAFPGKWTVPGGKLEVLDYALRPRDTSSHWYNVVEDLLRREIDEEVGLQIKNIGYVTSLVYIRDDNIPCLVISLWAEPDVDQSNPDFYNIKLCHALTDYKWVTLEEARNYDLIEGIYDELVMLDKKLKQGKTDSWNFTGNPGNNNNV